LPNSSKGHELTCNHDICSYLEAMQNHENLPLLKTTKVSNSRVANFTKILE